ncbi:hypothetical protein [Metabacillus rhizolycopersici]|uniref:Methyl-accepting chemotaxis protein n=1 Tax=Metabacillus rhizolycopersici TaxID=2875709 RepID=A0ABS7USR9_9BACI|nr:hypothetical protein [Metabacillus rhizolycopersici]MBZ5751082.1 hypothetical protein [Metabacillus rhizolycopersici]
MTDENRSVVEQVSNRVKRGVEATSDVAINSIDAVEDTGKAVVDRISNAVKDMTEK